MNNVTSTVAAYLELLEVPEGRPRREAWTRQYEAAHPDAFAKYYENWGSTDRRSYAADQVSTIAPILRERETRARSLVDAVTRDFMGGSAVAARSACGAPGWWQHIERLGDRFP